MMVRFVLILMLALLPFTAADARAPESHISPEQALADQIPDTMQEAAGVEDSAGGLPQFDPTWFASQIFWLLVVFALLYTVFARKSLPTLASIIENRKTHIQADLDLAEQLNAQAQSVQDAYEASLHGARDQSAAMLNDIQTSLQAKKNAQSEAFRAKSEEAVNAAEERLIGAKNQAMNDISDIVADVAAQAVEKIIGKPADAMQAREIVNNLAIDKKAA